MLARKSQDYWQTFDPPFAVNPQPANGYGEF